MWSKKRGWWFVVNELYGQGLQTGGCISVWFVCFVSFAASSCYHENNDYQSAPEYKELFTLPNIKLMQPAVYYITPDLK